MWWLWFGVGLCLKRQDYCASSNSGFTLGNLVNSIWGQFYEHKNFCVIHILFTQLISLFPASSGVVMYRTVLYSAVHYCTVVYRTVLYYTVLSYYTVLYFAMVYFIIMYVINSYEMYCHVMFCYVMYCYTVQYCNVLLHTVQYCNVLLHSTVL